jgi:hypothetical protein
MVIIRWLGASVGALLGVGTGNGVGLGGRVRVDVAGRVAVAVGIGRLLGVGVGSAGAHDPSKIIEMQIIAIDFRRTTLSLRSTLDHCAHRFDCLLLCGFHIRLG